MENLINIGIDLGTTNSAIAKFVKGTVVIYNNPQDYGRSTLPSVVGFKKDKILVGSKAKELLEKSPKSVVGAFKRKMGTSESFKIQNSAGSQTPISLSSFVLKELKTFLPPQEIPDSAVITIPASFDTIQSNATKEAGVQAGFKQVVLLQEPIAASLAYANMKKERELTNGQWLVYDFGGGTFDVALVRIKDGEMKVLDHEGDNFLGGTDFDAMIIEKIVIPKIEQEYGLSGLLQEMTSASGKYNAQYYALLNAAETAKITLSAKTSTEIIVDGIQDDNNLDIDFEVIITRSEFNALIKDRVDYSIDLVKTIITRNNLKPSDIQFSLMVGGSTFIPFVRQRVEEVLQVPINCEIDPTTAVAVGAAYYAATKTKDINPAASEENKKSLYVKAAYQRASKEKEEIFSAKITGDISGLFFRITREDGGFDTGMKKLTERINEDLPLVDQVYNFFKLVIYDGENNIIDTDLEMIGINSGFGINGQPLPEDICLEVDDYESPGDSLLLAVFNKNATLPLKRTVTRPLTKSVLKGTTDEVIRINVLEGPQSALAAANKTIGLMELTGKNISRDIQKGSDIEITLQMSESRDLTISVYLTMADQEFKQTFNPKDRTTSVSVLKSEIDSLAEKLQEELDEATQNENFESAKDLNAIRKDVESLAENIDSLAHDDTTDKRYQLEDTKRKLARAIDDATKGKRQSAARVVYLEQRDQCEALVDREGNDYERKHLNDIVAQENVFLESGNINRIEEKTDELHSLYTSILWRTPDFLRTIFGHLAQQMNRMNDQVQAKSLVDAGKFSIESQNWDRLREINGALINLLPKSAQADITTKIGF